MHFTYANGVGDGAHLALLNAIRRSMGRSLAELPFFLGGTLGRHEGTEVALDDPST